jgi:hypothetical protein
MAQEGGGWPYFTKLSSSLLFALMGGVVCSVFLLPPVARKAPAKVVLRVAIASCHGTCQRASITSISVKPQVGALFFHRAGSGACRAGV